MPGVTPEKRGFARMQPINLAGLRVTQDHDTADNIIDFVGGEDRAESVRVAECAAGSHAEDELMDAVAGDVEPVLDFAGLAIAPEMPRRVAKGDLRRRLEV